MVESLNIFLFNCDENLVLLVKNIFHSLQIKIMRQFGLELSPDTLAETTYHLLLLDISEMHFTPQDLTMIQRSFPELHTIMIADHYTQLQPFNAFPRLNLVSRPAIPEQLPMILNHFLNELETRQTVTFTFNRLILEALEHSLLFTLIVNQNSKILFINNLAREVLKIKDNELPNERFISYIKEGEKVWQYILQRVRQESNRPFHLALQLCDHELEGVVLPVQIQILSQGEKYLLIQNETIIQEGYSSALVRDCESMLKAFADSLANELLNPLNVIWGRLQLFQSHTQLEDKQVKNLNMVEKQVHRINDVIGKLHTFTSIQHDLVPQRISINDIIRQIPLMATLDRFFKKRPERIKFTLQKSLPVMFGQNSHFELLFQLLLELIFELGGAETDVNIQTRTLQEENHNSIEIAFTLKNFVDSAHRQMLADLLQLGKSWKQRYALEFTILNYIIQTYKVQHAVEELDEALCFRLIFLT